MWRKIHEAIVYFPDDIFSSPTSFDYTANKRDNQHMQRGLTQSITLSPAGNYLSIDEKDEMVIFTCHHGSSEIYM